jgi:transcriptional regulator with XRE-family HTH domain
MSQRSFCNKLGLNQSTYAPLETEKRPIRDAYVKLICQTYNVSEVWLRTGEGEMFVQKPDRELEELLGIYDALTTPLQVFLLKQARELQGLQAELNIKSLSSIKTERREVP